MMSQTIKVLFLAAEAEPFIKVGGLADVAGSLPLALRSLSDELDVRLVLPRHPSEHVDSAALAPVAAFPVHGRTASLEARLERTELEGMPVYFIDGEPFASESSVYSPDPTVDRRKYSFFSLAALELASHLDWQPDILHANDWHTALALYALRRRPAEAWQQEASGLLTVHNLPFMGGDGSDVLAEYGLEPIAEPGLPSWAWMQPLPLGLWAADAIVAVSPTYSHEILTPAFGCGLEGFLRQRGAALSGVLNGLPESAWDPRTDRLLAATFSADDLSNRPANKTALQSQLGLPGNLQVPLLAMIGRIDQQKGVDLALEALRQMLDLPWQFVLLGSGDKTLEAAAQALQAELPERVRVVLRYDAALSRLIYAAADLFLMPSRYEPCGLAQMIAMRYGAVPVVHATGGLKDTVQAGVTGFLFEHARAEALLEAIRRALQGFANPVSWQEYQRSGMEQDFSWTKSARQYASIYHSLTKQDRGDP
jgi:starch synthase